MEGIHCVDLNVRELALHLTEPWTKGVLQRLDLSLVRRDDSYLASHALLEALTLTCKSVQELDQVESEPDFVHVQTRLRSVQLFSRHDKVEEDAASHLL